MESKFVAEVVRTSVWKVALHLSIYDFLFWVAAADCDMILLAAICSSFPCIISNTDESVVEFGHAVVLVKITTLKTECMRVHLGEIDWNTCGVVRICSFLWWAAHRYGSTFFMVWEDDWMLVTYLCQKLGG